MANSNASPVEQQLSDNRFFFAYSVFLLAVVVVGFAPSLISSVAFQGSPIPAYLHLHGAILGGWFVCLSVQSWLIRSGNTRLHQKAGRFVAAYAALVVAGGLLATFNVVPRTLATGMDFEVNMAEVDPAIGADMTFLAFVSGVVWANIGAVVTFSCLIVAAVVLRNKSDTHKRLILVATVSIMGPALARIARYEILGGEQGPFIPLALLAMLAAIIIYDVVTLKRVHKATIVAALFAITLSVISIAISGSDFGQAFTRGLA